MQRNAALHKRTQRNATRRNYLFVFVTQRNDTPDLVIRQEKLSAQHERGQLRTSPQYNDTMQHNTRQRQTVQRNAIVFLSLYRNLMPDLCIRLRY